MSQKISTSLALFKKNAWTASMDSLTTQCDKSRAVITRSTSGLVWLVVKFLVSGEYFHHMKQQSPDHRENNISRQVQLLKICHDLLGVSL